MEVESAVALLAEGVDRNVILLRVKIGDTSSPSSRRAWIEILKSKVFIFESCVALLAEGVDRNFFALKDGRSAYRRPPRGGRG